MKLFEGFSDNVVEAQRRMLERKAKLGESVVIADSDGRPVTVSAQEALRIFARQ